MTFATLGYILFKSDVNSSWFFIKSNVQIYILLKQYNENGDVSFSLDNNSRIQKHYSAHWADTGDNCM